MTELGFTDGFAITAGLVHAFVAGVFLRFSSVRREWGLGWLACAYAASAVLNLLYWPVLRLPMASGFDTWHGLFLLVVGVTAIAALLAGVRQYTGHERPTAWAVFATVWLGFVALAASRMQWAEQDALPGNLAGCMIFVYMAWLFVQARRREPQSGHGLAAAMMALYPLLVLGSMAVGMNQHDVRQWAAVPFALAGLGVMSATMGRLRAQARELTATLESRVAERTQQLSEMISSLESFNSMVSHDLRGSLGGLAGLSDVALQAIDAGDTARARQVIGVVRRETGQLSSLVSGLLLLARASQGEVHKQQLNLSTLVGEALEQLAISQGDEVRHRVSCGEMLPVQADPVLLRQVLVNLVGNALKFSRQSSQPQVHLQAQPQHDGVVISVQDNGVGFDPARAAELFEPFKRLHAPGRFEGSGVGLTIVRRIVERHGGRVWADGAPGRGATFSVWLPA